MTKTKAFHPRVLDVLEDRIALSGMAAMAPRAERASLVQALRRPAVNRETALFEVRWMRAMINHHGMAIKMAKLALQNSQNSEVLALAQGIIRAQTREIGQLQTWLSAGYGVKGVRPRLTADDREMLRELGTQQGTEFDEAFLGMMIEHHTTAVSDAGDCLENAGHVKLRRLCTNIETTQTAEIAHMRELLGDSGGMEGGSHNG